MNHGDTSANEMTIRSSPCNRPITCPFESRTTVRSGISPNSAKSYPFASWLYTPKTTAPVKKPMINMPTATRKMTPRHHAHREAGRNGLRKSYATSLTLSPPRLAPLLLGLIPAPPR